MRAPEFWHHRESSLAAWLSPLGELYDVAGRLRSLLAHPLKLERPVICVGNLTAGGAGKTPVALALAAWLQARGLKPHFLTRGYGGSSPGPLRVDPAKHGFREVGDEALLLAALAPTWAARERAAGARCALAAGAELVIMDDGLQNPSLAKDLSLLVVDGGYGFGNGRVMPAGPLRETLARALARVQAAVLIGSDECRLTPLLEARVPLLKAQLVALESERALKGKRVLAFAGIGRPAKFYATLEALGCQLVARRDFADHHAYRADEIMQLVEEASALDAEPVTTEKDLVRFPPEARRMVHAVRVRL
ncbi:MAG TPA: tetraacyldisaccharide 4'-kinase, partial [Alphaproteobacteria bacterium]|nr:tetraacyldisaccharide 4'-kinase [Alphaproteobacteria bacterium]